MAWFPERNDPELERLAAIIFDLRREVFRSQHYHAAHEREWETVEQEARRERRNQEALREWDNDTLRMIRGDKVAEEVET